MMDAKEKLKHELEQELQWVQYRHKMLNIIEEKLLQMKQLAELEKHENLTSEELKSLNDKVNKLAMQIIALDSESRKIEAEKILK